MVKFKSRAWPDPSPGTDFTNAKKLVVPDQALSLQEILDRFTRNEALAIGKDVDFDDDPDLENPLNVDLEKLVRKDPVERDEYFLLVKSVTDRFKSEEEGRQKKIVANALKKRIDEAAAKKAEDEKKPSA